MQVSLKRDTCSQLPALLINIGLSKRALKPDLLDPDPRSGFNVVSRELHTARILRALHCWTGSHAMSYSTALSLSTARISDPGRGRVEAKWSLDLDLRFASDSVSRSRVESPHISNTKKILDILQSHI